MPDRRLLALTLHQPWALWVARGWKGHETRDWSTTYRGELAVHAGKTWNRETRAAYARLRRLAKLDGRLGSLFDLPPVPTLGAVVAVARLADCRATSNRLGEAFAWVEDLDDAELAAGDFSPGRYGWRLADVRPLREPYFLNGKQGLWSVSPEDTSAIRSRLRASTREGVAP